MRDGLGAATVVCEGGGILVADLFAARAVDELYLTVVPRILGGAAAPTLVAGAGFDPDRSPTRSSRRSSGSATSSTPLRVSPVRDSRDLSARRVQIVSASRHSRRRAFTLLRLTRSVGIFPRALRACRFTSIYAWPKEQNDFSGIDRQRSALKMKTTPHRHLGVLSALVLLAAGACVGPPDRDVSSDDMGSLSASLTLSPTASLNTASYAISGPNVFARRAASTSATARPSRSPWAASPRATATTSAITGTATDGLTTCSGSATFSSHAEDDDGPHRSRSSVASRRRPAASRSTAPSTSARWSTPSAPIRAR